MWESLSQNIVQFMGPFKRKLGCSGGGGGRRIIENLPSVEKMGVRHDKL